MKQMDVFLGEVVNDSIYLCNGVMKGGDFK